MPGTDCAIPRGMDALDKNRDNEVPLEKKLDDLYKLIDGIETAMVTTRRPDGQLVSRAMQTQRRTSGTDLWFMTNAESEKFEEIALDPHVNVAYYKDRTREWVSVSGRASLSKDRDLIDSLYKPDWKMWLGDQGGKYDGGPHDPRIALILVEAESATYSKKDRPTPLVLFQLAKGMITGQPPKVADLRELNRGDLQSPRGNADLR
jgi:general stress protein 26